MTEQCIWMTHEQFEKHLHNGKIRIEQDYTSSVSTMFEDYTYQGRKVYINYEDIS